MSRGGQHRVAMDVVLSRHAKNRMRMWDVSLADVLGAIDAPDVQTPSRHGRQSAWHYSRGRWLRVTYIDEAEIRVVVTVTVRRRGPEGEH